MKTISKFIAKVLVAALLVLNLNGLVSYANANDVTPTVTKLEVDKKEVKKGDKLTVSAQIDENGTEVYGVMVMFMKSYDDMPEITFLTYNKTTGKYQGKIDIVSGYQSGLWNAAIVDVVYDTAETSENELFMYNKNLLTDEDVKDIMEVAGDIASEEDLSKIKVVPTEGWENASYNFKKTDFTAPNAPTVNTVANNSYVLKGKAEPYAEISATVDGEEIGWDFANSKGEFALDIDPQKAGTIISVTAIDDWGNESKATTVKVIDKIPPKLSVNQVDDNDKSVSGKTEVGAVVSVKIGSKTYKATVDSKGNFKSSAIPVQKAGTSITVYSKDKAGNKSTKVVKVVDKTPPKAPSINTVTTKSTSIKGKAEANSTVYVKVGSKSYKAKANSKGEYSVKISKQKKGTSVVAYAVDKAGNKGPSKSIKVK